MAQHNDTGRWGESMAQRYLLLHDYHIRHVGWHAGHCEIDIVAEKLGYLIFVEVKTRSNDRFALPESAVDRTKMQHLLRAARNYVAFYHLEMPHQFDIISIVGTPDAYRVTHFKDAFDAYTLSDPSLIH
ncbi:MAG: YraN family protein [Bacteroidaceae bacterium]|nr:YraN family protein [Bacteroidaceae bacterium]